MSKIKKKAEQVKMLLRLIRLPNMLIIILTQVLLRYCVLVHLSSTHHTDALSPLPDFLLLVLVTILIAAGGYIINDYYDLKMDEINKPERQIVHLHISGKSAVKIHLILTGIATVLGFYLGFRLKSLSFALIFPVLAGMLWFYSFRYKCILVWGNLVVSFLSAAVVGIVWLYEFFWLRLHPDLFLEMIPNLGWITRIVLAYSLFAFLVSLIREIIKDIEDQKGDRAGGCRTIPLVFGVKWTRVIISVLILVTIVLLGYSQVVLYRLHLLFAFGYLMMTVQVPLLYLLVKVFQAKTKSDHHYLSNLSKIIMVAGILSMQLLSAFSNTSLYD